MRMETTGHSSQGGSRAFREAAAAAGIGVDQQLGANEFASAPAANFPANSTVEPESPGDGMTDVVFAEADAETLRESELAAQESAILQEAAAAPIPPPQRPEWFGGRPAAPSSADSSSADATRTTPSQSAGATVTAAKSATANVTGRIRPVRSQPLIPIAASDEEPPRHWLQRALASCGVSLMFHAIILLALTLIIVVPKGPGGPLALTAGLSEIDEPAELEDISLEEAGGSSEPIEMAPLEIARNHLEDLQAPLEAPELPDSIPEKIDGTAGEGEGEGSGSSTGNGKGLPFRLPEGGGSNIARKGSFSAWTVPEDPEPGQNYIIVIQIELPENVRRLARKDLLGSLVIGTDGYRQFIPGNTRGFLPGNEKQVQMAVMVPGAGKLVRDTIKIKSRVLKEEQTLEIEF